MGRSSDILRQKPTWGVHFLSAPLPGRLLTDSLDSYVAVVSSTPPFPTFSFSANGFNSFSHSQPVIDPSTGLYTSDPLLSDPSQGSCSVKEDAWIGAQSASPSSPFTIDSQTDSQAGGDYIPPASESTTSESPSASQHRRAFPNLNISLPPTGLQVGAGVSPVSFVSSGAGAAFSTDPLSMNVDPGEDYFRFSEAALPGDNSEAAITSSVSLPQSTRPTPSPLGSGTGGPMVGGMMPTSTSQYRLPASQPSSPVRGVFMSGQQQFALSPVGRQRSTTLSGIPPTFDPNFAIANAFGGPLQLPPHAPQAGAVSAPVTAVPAHLAFTSIHSPVATPMVQSPGLVASVAASPATEPPPNAPPNALFGGEANKQANAAAAAASSAQTGTGGDVTMEDATTSSSRRSSGGSPQSTGVAGPAGTVAPALPNPSVAAAAAQPPSTNDIAERLTLEKLTMLDNIVSEAQSAKAALLSGQQDRLPEALGKISNQLDLAGDLGIVRTPRETTPNSGTNNSISPRTFSPTAQSSINVAPPLPAPSQISALPTAALLPSLPVGQPGIPSAATSVAEISAASAAASAAASTAASALSSPVAATLMRPATTADFTAVGAPHPPPLVHSHSFPNGHALPSQVVGPAPTTPINATFAQAGVPGVHMPMVSSPLAVLPPSRPASPRMQQQQWLPQDGGAAAAASAAMAAATGHNMMDPQQQMMHAQAIHQQMQAAAMMQNQMVQQQAQQQHAAVVAAAAQQQQAAAQQAQAQAQAQQQAQAAAEGSKSRRSSVHEQRADGRPIARARSSSVAKPGTLGMSSVPPSAWQSRAGSPVDEDEDDDDEDDDDAAHHRRPKRRRSSAGPDVSEVGPTSGVHISDDIRAQLDQIFNEFLNRVCSDLDSADSKGEKLHQVLMPKKMQRLDESPDYRPFKFRIQAFTNAFHEELQSRGINEETMSIKKVKVYLWHQDLISRFNADGKKAKSKGNHIWHVDAKKLPGGGWVFRPFKRKIIVTPASFAVINQRYEWEPKIWDPMAPSSSIKPTFSSPPGSLPPWLHWEDGVRLVGVPDAPQPAVHVQAKAEFIDGSNKPATATTEFTIQVVSMPMPMPTEDAVFAGNPMVQQWVTDGVGHPLVMPPPMPTVQGSVPYGAVPMYPQPGYGH